MPSASVTNNKLEKRSSISSVSGGLTGGSAQIETVVNPKNNNNNELTSNKNVKAAVGATGISASAAGQPNVAASDAMNPMKLTLVTIDHKIRNLEKRKTKLESYRTIQVSGKELSSDQKAAVAKYDAVAATLEFARDLSKQILQFAKEAEKEQKKQTRKDNIAKAYAETAKIREVLIIQNVLSCFTDDAIRSDFLAGENGASKLEASDVDVLEKFCSDIQTRRPESNDDVPFITAAQKAAELFSMTIDARPKQYGDLTFEKLRSIFNQIHECGYLDKVYLSGEQTSGELANDDETANAAELEETASLPTEENSLDEGIDKLHLTESATQDQQHQQLEQSALVGVGVGGGIEADVVVGGLLQQQHPEQQQLIDPQLQQQQHAHVLPPQGGGQPQQQIATIAAVAGAPYAAQAQQVQSGNTTPVHMLYQTAAGAPQQQAIPTQPGQQQLPPATSMLPPPPPQMVAAAQQRQLLSSPVGNQLPPNALPLHPAPPGAAHFPPTTVRAVEQGYFKQHQQQYIQQQLRPLADVIGGGSFYFLQESELDSPDVNASSANANAPVQGLVYEQQAQQQQMPTTPQQQQQILGNHVEELQQQPQPTSQQLLQQQQQTIPTQTFTNQSFPPLQQQQQQQHQTQQQNIPIGTSGNTPTLVSNTPSPLFQQQQQQQPMLIMTRLATQQTRLPPQQLQQPLTPNQQQLPPQAIGIQTAEVSAATNAFPFDSTVVSGLSYEQQLQQQMVVAATLKSNVEPEHQQQQIINDDKNDWNACSGSDTNLAATAALTNVLKTSAGKTIETTSNKWSAEMNALGTPPAQSGSIGGGGGSSSRNKNDWSSGSGRDSGSYPDAVAQESNHWNSQQDNGGGGGYSRRAGNYQQRRNDDRRNDDRDRGRNNMGGGNYRSRNYGNSAQQQNGRGGSGGGGGGNGNNSGMYFRNNEHSSASGGNSSYYQNGSNNVYSGKDSRYDSNAGGGGGNNNYRGPRNTNGRGNNAPPQSSRGLGRGPGNSGTSSYMNPPRQSNRMPMGLENKN